MKKFAHKNWILWRIGHATQINIARNSNSWELIGQIFGDNFGHKKQQIWGGVLTHLVHIFSQILIPHLN